MQHLVLARSTPLEFESSTRFATAADETLFVHTQTRAHVCWEREGEMRALVATVVAAASLACVQAQYAYVEIGAGCCRTSDGGQGTNVDIFIVTSVDECAAACSGGAFTPTAPCAPMPYAHKRRDGCDVYILCDIHACACNILGLARRVWPCGMMQNPACMLSHRRYASHTFSLSLARICK